MNCQTARVAFTLTIDCGGGGIKGSVLDEAGTMRAQPLRVPTPYPLPPDLFVKTLVELGEQLPSADRVTVGMPGMLRHGVVVATPHYVTRSGPRTKVDPELVDAWYGFDARTALAEAFGLPTLVLNDAEVHGAGVVAGHRLRADPDPGHRAGLRAVRRRARSPRTWRCRRRRCGGG